ncbi:hypothetical protein BDF20DRAFT_912053 [Mycotypha africana]|uniref:uncharacterized protein n=1 Tax=Mycotypha africana TaxID=64632 RepID=UPI002301553F|nr:uncharacterized protein BDF20DRAFT_912053 [Mycotypha africana]KAI8981810.1 hypothetical protein BDF20DRAFT_912053 [Mycotypha africana]
MSKSIKALSFKGKEDWNTSIFSFSRNIRNNFLWEKDTAAQKALKHLFQHCLSSTPAFKHTPSRVTIQLYYYADPSIPLEQIKLEPLEKLLSTFYPGKFVDMRLVRLHYPYMNSEVLAQYIALNAERIGWSQLARKLFQDLPIVKAPLHNNMPAGVQWQNLLPHVSNGQLTSGIAGIKFQASGRLGRKAAGGRSQILRKSVGTFRFTTHKSLIDAGRHTFTNRNGRITVKVWVSTALFGVNALANKLGRKAVQTVTAGASKI